MKKILLALALVLITANVAAAPCLGTTYSHPVSQPSLGAIVKAVCLVETDNRPRLKGKAGERGIMQMCRNEWEFTTHKLMGVSKKTQLLNDVDYSWTSAFNKDKAIRVGTAYLQYLINKYDNWEMAVMVYNAGHRGVFKLKRGGKYLWMVKKTMATGNTAWRKSKNKRN